MFREEVYRRVGKINVKKKNIPIIFAMSLLLYLHVQEIKPPRTKNYNILDRGIFFKI